MNNAMLLDCTLRDGAYLIDKEFGDVAISGIIKGLAEAGVDFVEIGFLQDEGFGEGRTVFKNTADARRFLPSKCGKTNFALMADYSRYSIENLDYKSEDSVGFIRECFFKHERFEALKACKKIKAKEYGVFIQPVDILGYSDKEILELIELANQIEPYCFAIVDTFGSMYEEDLQRVYSLIDHNLRPECKIGFHSHNNMQLSSALSQAFLRMANGKRQVIIDGTISGMGRGAGNTPTELIAQYMVAKHGYSYDIDAILDLIDGYMDNIRTRCSWGYTTPYFLAGCYSAHVNNITYMTRRNSIRSKDIRYILNRIGAAARKRYDYDLLEQTYLDCMQFDIDDRAAIEKLQKILRGRKILMLVPGNSVTRETARIQEYLKSNDAVVISVNFLHKSIPSDYVYISNVKRYQYWVNDARFAEVEKIITSNIPVDGNGAVNACIVSFRRLVKCGWESLDNSAILLLRLLDILDVGEIQIAGFDGYSFDGGSAGNYADKKLELSNVQENPMFLNKEISCMLNDFKHTRVSGAPVHFLTESRFASVLE